jgi:hypothetical protein
VARAAFVQIVVIWVLMTGCGGDSGGSPTSKPAATEESTQYREQVNALFDRVVAAKGDYEDAQGAQQVRAAGQELDRQVQAAIEQMKTLDVPARAKAVHAQLQERLTTLHRDLVAALEAKRLDTAQLGEAVRETTPADRVVNAINALP